MASRTALRVAAAAGAVALGGLAVVAPAHAAAEGRIASVNASGSTLQVVFSATGLAAGQSIDPASVRLQVQGVEVPSEAVPVSESTSSAAVSVLVMDTSGSMAGERLSTAKQSALSYLATVPASAKVGLVTFSTTAQERVGPTTDRAAVQRVIDGLVADGDTAMYDGVVQGVRTVGVSGPRNLLLLTDGEDTSSKASLDQASQAVRSSRAVLDVVSIGTAGEQVQQVQQLADAGNGRVIASDDLDVVVEAFTSAAVTVANQLAVTATIPTDLGGKSGNLTVTASAGGTSISDTAFASIPVVTAAPAQVTDYGPKAVAAPSGPSLSEPWVIALGALALFVGLAYALAVAFRTAGDASDPSRSSARRLSFYTLSGRSTQAKPEAAETALGTSQVARSAVELANRVVAKRDFETRLGDRLERAAVPLKPAEFLLLGVGGTLALALMLLLLTGGSLLAALIGVVIGALVPGAYLSYRQRQRQAKFQAQLPETLQLIAGGLSSGYSLPQAIDAAVKDAEAPMSTEMSRALVESRLGVPIEDALEGIAARMRSVDFSWVVMAIRIQREVGGNLSEILNTTAETMRERERLRRQVQVLSAEGRLSAWILAGLPIAFAIYLALARPEYLSILWTEVLGWVLIIVAALLMIVGILWLRKAVKVEV
jgi:tight adherence protein B